jgi:uncharacterized protein YaaN involved in tellurite resistance
MDITDDLFERMTILERAQFLYDSAQWRHSATLDRHEADLLHHREVMDALQRNQDFLIAQGAALQVLVDKHDDQIPAIAALTLQHEERMQAHTERMNTHTERMDAIYLLINQHDDDIVRHTERMDALYRLSRQQEEGMAELRLLIQAIKERLEGRNGH